MEKPPLLNIYDGVTHHIDYLDSFKVMLHYYNIEVPIKCRLFLMALRKIAID